MFVKMYTNKKWGIIAHYTLSAGDFMVLTWGRIFYGVRRNISGPNKFWLKECMDY
jgi:hypothetical protein